MIHSTHLISCVHLVKKLPKKTHVQTNRTRTERSVTGRYGFGAPGLTVGVRDLVDVAVGRTEGPGMPIPSRFMNHPISRFQGGNNPSEGV